MPVPVLLAGVLKTLAANGLGMLANAVIAKGKDVVEKELGVKIPEKAEELTPEKMAELKALEFKHEEFLVEAGLREKELEIKAEQGQEEERTKRWQLDMQSDSWLSKNVRPITLVYWTVAITLLILVDSIKALAVDIPEVWVDLILYSYLTILSGYYTIRGAEKITKMITSRKKDVAR